MPTELQVIGGGRNNVCNQTYLCYVYGILRCSNRLLQHIKKNHRSARNTSGGENPADDNQPHGPEQEKEKKNSRFKCAVCQKSFRFRARLATHEQVHVEMSHRERRYPCQTCGKRFLRSGDLWAHSKIHSGKR